MAARRAAADVVVLGGGLVGCAIARALARRGARVVVCERATVGAEASGAAAGMIAPQAEADAPGPLVELGVESRRRWPAFAAAVQEESGLDPEYRADGILYVARDARAARVLAARARWQERAGLRVATLTAAAARKMAPVLPARVALAVHFPDDHRVHNGRATRAAAVSARRAGADVREGCAALALVARRGRVVGVETSAGAVRADVVVNALGAWAASVTVPGVAPPPVVPVRGQMLVLRAAPDALALPLYAHDVYVVPREGGELLVGATVEHVGFDRRVTLDGVASLASAARALAPGLGGATLSHAYAGLRPGTRDGMPVVGAVRGCAGLFVAGGLYRNGILLAPAVGDAIADLVTSGRTDVPIASFSPGGRGSRGR